MKKKKGELAWAVVRDADLEAVKLEKDAEDQGKKVIGQRSARILDPGNSRRESASFFSLDHEK